MLLVLRGSPWKSALKSIIYEQQVGAPSPSACYEKLGLFIGEGIDRFLSIIDVRPVINPVLSVVSLRVRRGGSRVP